MKNISTELVLCSNKILFWHQTLYSSYIFNRSGTCGNKFTYVHLLLLK